MAALLVVFQHVRQLFFKPMSSGAIHGAAKLFAYFTGQGSAAVSVFFVLSGFLIASTIKSSVERDRWSWTRYFDARLTRLWVPLVPALVLTAFWDRLGLSLSTPGAYPYYPYIASASGQIEPSTSLFSFLGNLFFLQNILVPVFGTDGPLWSLSPEFWYYVMFPLAYVAFKGRALSKAWRFALLFAALAVLPFTGHETVLRYPLWLCGAALAFLPCRDWGASLGFRATALAVFLLMTASEWIWGLVYLRLLDVATVVSFSALVWGMLCVPKKDVSGGYARAAELGAGFSYTLYLAHFPLAAFIASRLFPNGPTWEPSPLTVAFALGISGLLVVYSLMVWYPFERNTRRIRKALFRFQDTTLPAQAKVKP